MYSCININNTERKQIGVPILRRTDEMISQFDLDYERYYKLGKLNSQREKEFREYLKKKEQIHFYLTKLIKILRVYFQENKFNFNTFYPTYVYKKFQNKKTRKKRPKSYKHIKNKHIYFNIFKKYENLKKIKSYKPYMYPLDISDRKRYIIRRIKTEWNYYHKTREIKMTQNELKLYVDNFGSYPVNFIKKENAKNKKKKKNTFNALKNYYYHSKSLDNKTHLLLKKGTEMKEKYFGGFDKMKKYVEMKYKNALNLKAKFANKKIEFIINRLTAPKRILRNKKLLHTKNTQYNSSSDINKNTVYENMQKKNLIDKNMFKTNYSAFNSSNINLLSSSLNKRKISQNNIINNNENHSQVSTIDIKNKSNKSNKSNINLKRNTSYDYITKFGTEFSKTIKNSKKIKEEISFSNKIFSMTKNNYHKASRIIEKTKLKKINMTHLLKHDIFAQKRKDLSKFKYIKENKSGNIKINIYEHIRKPTSKNEYIREYNVKREQLRKYKDKDLSDNSSDEEKSEFNLFSENEKNIKNLILNPDKKIKIKFAVSKKL